VLVWPADLSNRGPFAPHTKCSWTSHADLDFVYSAQSLIPSRDLSFEDVLAYIQGLSEKEAMEISGRKTRAVFDRYHIVSERRMKLNAEKLEAHLKAKDTPETVTDRQGDQIEVL
jgi:hypothetical protein